MEEAIKKATKENKTWLVTGCAGFIGCHLTERLLRLGQTVRGLDNLSTGFMSNIEEVLESVGPEAAKRFTFTEADVTDEKALDKVMKGVDFVSHQAALGSVPRSIDEPMNTVRSNVDGFMAVVKAAVDNGARRVVYASSSSVYGDHPDLPKVEDRIGASLSPYAASKLSDEIFATACANSYDIELVGLRYFNIFGPRQSVDGPYAAVIPRWITDIMNGKDAVINGDPQISRDFTYVDNAVNANIMASVTKYPNDVCNIAAGERTTLMELLSCIIDVMMESGALSERPEPVIGPARPGDVKHSLADVSKAMKMLDYSPQVGLREGLRRTFAWFQNNLAKKTG